MNMKRKLTILIAICSLLLILIPACDAREAGSLKALTKPYIAHYECTDATLGEENLLDKFEYIEIILVNKEKMELIYKQKDGEKRSLESKYSFNPKTRELTAEIGILGYTFRQSTIVEKGKFTITKTIGNKQLIMKFKVK